MLRLLVVTIMLLGCTVFYVKGDCTPINEDTERSQEAKLHADLFCNYRTDYRPVKNHSQAVTVSVSMSLKYFTFEAHEDILNVHAWLILKWHDQYLSWDPNNYGGIESLIVDSTNIWQPRMSLFNGEASLINMDFFYTQCLLDSSGVIGCVPRVAYAAICKTNMKYWPYDEQNCTLSLGAWMHAGEQINFTIGRHMITLDTYDQGHDWLLKNVSVKRLSGILKCCPNETYPSINFMFLLKRIDAGHSATIVVPTFVLVALTLSSFIVNPTRPLRVHLLLLSILGHFLYMMHISLVIPKQTEDTPFILLFIRDSLFITSTVLVITLILLYIYNKTTIPPSWICFINKIFTDGPGRYVVFTEFDPAAVSIIPVDEMEHTPTSRTEDTSKNNKEWNLFCNTLNSITVFVCSVAYFILILAKIPYGKVEVEYNPLI